MRYIFLLVVFCTLTSCESESKRSSRVAEDGYVYETFSPSSFHVDKKCKKLKSSDSYKMHVKRDLEIVHGDICTEFKDGSWTVLLFCPVCTKTGDVEKMKSQMCIWKKSKNHKDVNNDINTIQRALLGFNIVIQVHPEYSNEQLLRMFPEFKNDLKILQAAFEYSTTLRSGKYESVDEFNYQFPEFFNFNYSDNIHYKYLSYIYTLISNNYSTFTRSYIEFVSDMRNEGNRQRLHHNLIKDEVLIPVSYEFFSAQMGF